MRGEFNSEDLSLDAIAGAQYTSAVDRISQAISASATIPLREQVDLQMACVQRAHTLYEVSGHETDMDAWAKISDTLGKTVSKLQNSFRSTLQGESLQQQIAL